jgi:hypothetical protein
MKYGTNIMPDRPCRFVFRCPNTLKTVKRYHDTQSNSIQHYDTQDNHVQHNKYKMPHSAKRHSMLVPGVVKLIATIKFILFSVIMPSVVMLNVVVPTCLAHFFYV